MVDMAVGRGQTVTSRKAIQSGTRSAGPALGQRWAAWYPSAQLRPGIPTALSARNPFSHPLFRPGSIYTRVIHTSLLPFSSHWFLHLHLFWKAAVQLTVILWCCSNLADVGPSLILLCLYIWCWLFVLLASGDSCQGLNTVGAKQVGSKNQSYWIKCAWIEKYQPKTIIMVWKGVKTSHSYIKATFWPLEQCCRLC